MLKYSNGYGHLIMSVFLGIAGLILIIVPVTDAGMKAIGGGLLLTVSGAWFVPGAAKQMATQIMLQQQARKDEPSENH